jgi:signal transduction histidine kinase
MWSKMRSAPPVNWWPTGEYECSVHLPETITAHQGDRDQLIQAMVNLISNAVKFCDPDHGMIDDPIGI